MCPLPAVCLSENLRCFFFLYSDMSHHVVCVYNSFYAVPALFLDKFIFPVWNGANKTAGAYAMPCKLIVVGEQGWGIPVGSCFGSILALWSAPDLYLCCDLQ